MNVSLFIISSSGKEKNDVIRILNTPDLIRFISLDLFDRIFLKFISENINIVTTANTMLIKWLSTIPINPIVKYFHCFSSSYIISYRPNIINGQNIKVIVSPNAALTHISIILYELIK